jgi:hypothetical protein
MRCEGQKSASKRAIWLALLCALVLQGVFPAAARPALGGASDLVCATDAPGSESGGGRQDSRHDFCCTIACAACCTIVAAVLAGEVLVLPLRRPSRVGLAEDQLAAAGAPLDLYFAARGPPRL